MRSRSLRIATALVLVALVAVLSCGGADGLAPPRSAEPGALARSSDSTLLAGLIVSGPFANTSTLHDLSTASATVSMNSEASWVSLVPESVADGVMATISNLRTSQRTTVPIVDGGFDPQRITASLDDTLEITVSRAGKPDVATLLRVGPRLAPRIVRTRPPRGQTDAPLNTLITIVFSEPVNPASVSATSVTLSTAGSPVAGTVRMAPGAGYTVELEPSALLLPNTPYSLTVSGVVNLAGTPLAAPVTITFATGGSESSGFVASVRVSPDPATTKVGERIQLTVTQTDATGQIVPTADRPVTWTSSAPDVASVNPRLGEVVGIGPGTVVITARSTADGQTGTARITVNQTMAPVGAIVTTLCDDIGICEGIYAVEPDGTNGRLLTGNGSDADPVWSADGKFIAFHSRRGCDRASRVGCFDDLYIMKGDGSGIGADGAGLRSLTAGSGLEVGGISWSPDGSRLVFAAGPFPPGYDVGDDLYVVNADGSGMRRLVPAPARGSLAWPDWSPDGSRIVYNVTAPGDTSAINVVNVDGSSVARVSTPPDSSRDLKPRWSPDGKRIAFTRWRRTSNAPSMNQTLTMNADGSDVTPVMPESLWPWFPAWSPDGVSLAVFASYYDGFFVVNADRTEGRQTTILCCGFGLSSLSWRRAPAAVPAPAQPSAQP